MKVRKYLKINTVEELSKQLCLSLDMINRAVLNLDKYYTYRENVKDKKGKERNFYKANGVLKVIHGLIDKKLLNNIDFPDTIQGGIKKRSIKTNADFHAGKRYVANFDITKFFSNVSNAAVYQAFIDQKCAPDVARILTQLTTINGELPQGFTTSPKISGLVLKNTDERLSKLLKPLNLVHTFWIDDLTISGYYPIAKLKKIINKIFKQCGFPLNVEKTKIANRKRRQQCTGLTVNCRTNPSKKFRENIRRELFICEKFGVKKYLNENNYFIDVESYLRSLKGRVSFLCSINPKYHEYKDRALSLETKTLGNK